MPSPSTASSASIAPEVVQVSHAKLVDGFETARLSQGEAWGEMLAAEQLERVMSLDIPSDPGAFHFPAELWIRCLYDALVAYHRPGIDRERLLAALTPLYFARTAGFIAETERDDHRPGRAGDRGAGSRVRGR